MPEEDMVDIKFRLYDGSDIGPFRCSSSTSTVDMLKQRIVSDWPRGKASSNISIPSLEILTAKLRKIKISSCLKNVSTFRTGMSFIQWDFLLCYFGCIFLIYFFFFILGKTITPKVVNEIKLISSGKVLDNNKTVGQCRTPFGEVAGGVIIMHVVVQPSLAKTKTEKKLDNSRKQIACSCSIM